MICKQVNDTGITLVADTGSLFETITADIIPDFFNANGDENEFDARSDAKGPEPEVLLVADVDDSILVFVGLERVGGIVVLDVTDPANPVFQDYVNRRNFGVASLEDAVCKGVPPYKWISSCLLDISCVSVMCCCRLTWKTSLHWTHLLKA